MAIDTRQKIRKIIEEYELGLFQAGLNKTDKIDYDILAGVRTKCWDNLEELLNK